MRALRYKGVTGLTLNASDLVNEVNIYANGTGGEMPGHHFDDIMLSEVFTKGYWKQPPLDHRKIGERDADVLYVAVGKALTNWQYADDKFCRLFVALTRPTLESGYVVFRAFGRIEALGMKCDVTLAAAEAFFDQHWAKEKEVHSPISKLVDAIRHAGHRRNEIAHGTVQGLWLKTLNFYNFTGVDYQEGYYLGPLPSVTQHTKNQLPAGEAETPLRYQRGS